MWLWIALVVLAGCSVKPAPPTEIYFATALFFVSVAVQVIVGLATSQPDWQTWHWDRSL
jgi:uncharacterized membrane protein